MKRILVMTVLILVVSATYNFAQMGHGMMREKQGMGQGYMMEHGKMMDSMKGMTQDMSSTMRMMSEVMGRGMSGDSMQNMSAIMKDMCAEMNSMSEIMDKGMATEDDMNKMHKRMMEIQKKMGEIKK